MATMPSFSRLSTCPHGGTSATLVRQREDTQGDTSVTLVRQREGPQGDTNVTLVRQSEGARPLMNNSYKGD